MYCVYALIKNINDSVIKRIFYIGITNNYLKRMNHHQHEKKNPIKLRIMKKYGWSHFIIWDSLSKEEAKEREIFLIKYFGRIDLKTGQLANMTDGGEGCLSLSEELKTQIGEKVSGFSRLKRKELVQQFKESKLSRTEYCIKYNISYGRFKRWVAKYAPELKGKSFRKQYNLYHNERAYIELICKRCSKKHTQRVDHLKRSLNNFCSRKCAVTYTNNQKRQYDFWYHNHGYKFYQCPVCLSINSRRVEYKNIFCSSDCKKIWRELCP